MFCGKCGNELPDGTKFCGKCGALQGGGEITELVAEQAVQDGKPVYRNREEYQREFEATHKKKKLPLIIGIVVAVIVVIVIISVIISSLTGFSVDSVKDSTLPYFDEDLTIGEAFAGAFHKEKWKFDEDEDSNEKYVYFDGYFNATDGDEIKVEITFLYDSEIHDSNDGQIYSVMLSDEYGNTANLYTQEDFDGFFNYVFKGEEFEWTWDGYEDYYGYDDDGYDYDYYEYEWE